MKEYACQECFWRGIVETTDEVDESRRAVETTDIDHCPICGTWGLVEK